MHNRTDRGWVRAGLAVLVSGILGGGVLAVAGGPNASRKVTADGVATAPSAAATPLEPAAPKEAPAGQDAPEVGDKVLMGGDGGSVTVSAVEDSVSAGRLFGAGDGFKYVAAEVKGCSGPNEKNITFEPSYFLLRLDDGTIRDSGPGVKKPSLEGGTIPAGKCLSGWVTFTVPERALPTAVIYDGSARTTWTVPLPENAEQTTTTTARAATTATTEDSDDSGDPDGSKSTSTTRSRASTTSTTKAKSTATTARSTATTGKSTATTGKSTATTGKSTATTARSGSTTTTKPPATTASTGKSATASTTTTSASKTTTTTGPARSETTTKPDANVEPDPADSEG